jgi:hypothetical protein
MTSQVAVLNLRGIAVASDTVVSVTTDETTKTMGNMEKIYQLSDVHKILLLHSGSMRMNDVPLALYVSEWSKTLPTPLPTLQDYVESFIKWASRESLIHTADSESGVMNAVLSEHFRWTKRNVQNRLRNVVKERGEKSEAFSARTKTTIEDEILQATGYLDNLGGLKGITEPQASKLLQDAGFDLDSWTDFHFGDFDLTEIAKASLREAASKSISRFQTLDTDATLSFVGYGADEPFGGSIKVVLRGIYGTGLKTSVEERFGVAPDDQTGITHFAQGDAIAAFIRGYHFRIMDKSNALYQSEIRNKFADSIDLENKLTEIKSAVQDGMSDFSHDSFVGPLLDTIGVMNVQGLGEFAESLVALQATSTYAQKGPATVGGYIEVATIDRTNGVRWVKSLEVRRNSR